MRLHVRHWGDAADPALFMLHGWMDTSITFQFVVDAFKRNWHIIAPDWRGFGHSDWSASGYWFPDYLGDLDALLHHFSPDKPVYLLGQSMGGNVANVYAGVHPDRVSKLVSLEGYGTMRAHVDSAPDRYAQWLSALQKSYRIKAYASLDEIRRRVKRNNPRLTEERADFIARHWAKQNEKGEWFILADPLHRRINPVMSRMDELLACWSRITAPTLWLDGEWSLLGYRMGDDALAREEIKRRASVIRNVRVVTVKAAGHMIQHDQPDKVAELVESFLCEQEA
jgi:pimeloyl-ACP methyl ester carboxylesterase